MWRLFGPKLNLGAAATSTAILSIAVTLGSPMPRALADKSCTLQRLIEAPMLQNDDFSPVVSIPIDGKPRKVLLDTGGFWSMIDPQILGGYTMRRAVMTSSLGLQGLPLENSVKVKSLQIGPSVVNDVEFYVAPNGYLRMDASLGANWLKIFDVEIDPVKNTASLFSKDHCDGQVVYWPHQDLAVVPFRFDDYGNHVMLPLSLNGEKLNAIIDTGAPETSLSMRAAKRLFDLTPDSPGMQAAGYSEDGQGHAHKIYRFQFKSLEMGAITFKNPWITIADMVGGNEDIILGMHQLHALHLYFAYGEKQLYVTSAGGDIAAQKAAATPQAATVTALGDPLGRINAQDFARSAYEAIRKDDFAGAAMAIEKAIQSDPGYADAYILRADIYREKGENALALKDYEQALRLDPDNLDAYDNRADMKWQAGDRAGALFDAGQAIGHDPANTRGYLLRAGFEVKAGKFNDAIADATDAMRMAPTDIKPVSVRAQIYARMQDYTHAYEDQTVVVKLQPKSSGALNNRCWFGAILGKLDDALDDCNASLDIAPRSASTLDSRAFVRMKMGQWDRAQKDYDSALAIDPKLASSLFGRSQVELQKGDVSAAASDLAAAKTLDPQIAQHFGK